MEILIRAWYPSRLLPKGHSTLFGVIAKVCGGKPRGKAERDFADESKGEAVEAHVFQDWEKIAEFLRRSHKIANDEKVAVRFDIRASIAHQK